MWFECESRSSADTRKIGELLAKEILVERLGTTAKVLALLGDLGSGKTTFLQGFAKGLGIKQRILSPTFVILKKFKIEKVGFDFFYHIDCYRIQKEKEILALGFGEISSNPKNIIAIEWGDRIKKVLPRNSLFIEFKFIDKNKRRITIGWE